MTFRLIGRIFLITISIATLSDTHAQKTTNPGINTLYVPIGKLHPRSDFAGILINLNVAAAIKRGKLALSMTNTFLQNHVSRQEVTEYSGKDRVIHFIKLKQDKVQHNLDMLEAALHAATEKFKVQDESNNPPSRTHRQTQQRDEPLNNSSY